MSTRTLYEQTRNQLYSWIKEVFETPNKIIESIESIRWAPEWSEPGPAGYFNYESPPLIKRFTIGQKAETALEDYKLNVLREYAVNPGICRMKICKLNDGQKTFLKKELKKHEISIEKKHERECKKEVAKYDNILNEL